MQLAREGQSNLGLLVMRLGIAVTLLIYALPKLLGGVPMWIQAGQDLRFLQADFNSRIVGLILLVVQVAGSIGLITGGLFRISAVLLTIIYSLHFLDFISVGYRTLPLYSAALACACIGLMITGPGRFAVAVKIEKK